MTSDRTKCIKDDERCANVTYVDTNSVHKQTDIKKNRKTIKKKFIVSYDTCVHWKLLHNLILNLTSCTILFLN